MAKRVTFRMGDLFDPDDVESRWAATLALIWNDLAFTNQRLIAGMESGAEPHENLYDARALVSAVWEATKFLRDTQNEASIEWFLKALPEEVVTDYRAALRATEPEASDSGFKRRLAAMRDLSSHYPELDRKHMPKALGKLSDEEGLIVSGDRFIDVRADFADQIATNLVFDAPPDSWVREFTDFVTTLREVVLPLMRFLQAALGAHLEQHRNAITITPE